MFNSVMVLLRGLLVVVWLPREDLIELRGRTKFGIGGGIGSKVGGRRVRGQGVTEVWVLYSQPRQQ